MAQLDLEVFVSPAFAFFFGRYLKSKSPKIVKGYKMPCILSMNKLIPDRLRSLSSARPYVRCSDMMCVYCFNIFIKIYKYLIIEICFEFSNHVDLLNTQKMRNVRRYYMCQILRMDDFLRNLKNLNLDCSLFKIFYLPRIFNFDGHSSTLLFFKHVSNIEKRSIESCNHLLI